MNNARAPRGWLGTAINAIGWPISLALAICGCGAGAAAGVAPTGAMVAGAWCSGQAGQTCGTSQGAQAVLICVSGLWQPQQVCLPGGACLYGGGVFTCSTPPDVGDAAAVDSTADSTPSPAADADGLDTEVAQLPADGALVDGASAKCTSKAQCDDGDPCTVDECAAGYCAATPASGPAGSCEDGDPCTVDGCASGKCVMYYRKVGAGCATDAVDGPDGSSDSSPALDGGSGAALPASIVDVQKASAACTGDPASFGEHLAVAVKGAVVTTPQKKVTADGSLLGLYVQAPGGGPWSGLFVIGKKGTDLEQAKVGDVLDIVGDIKDYYCFTQMNSKWVTFAEASPVAPSAFPVTTLEIGDIAGKAATEPFESVLVELHDVVVGNDALGADGKPHGDQFIAKVSNANALRMGAAFPSVANVVKNANGTYSPKWPKGTKLGTVTGVLEYSFGVFRLVISKEPQGVLLP